MLKPYFLTRLSLCLAMLGVLTSAFAQAPQENIRPEVLRALQAAQELNKQNKNAEALSQFGAIDALPAGNPLEVFTTERLRAVIALAAGDSAHAVKSLEKALNTGRGTTAERVPLMEHLALNQYRLKVYSEAALWAGRYLESGGEREQLRLIQAQALYLSGQYKGAAQVLQSRLDVATTSRTKPEEVEIRMLANSYQQLKDESGYLKTLETLTRHYPKPDVWADLIFRQMRRQTAAAYLELDWLRLLRQVGATLTLGDAMDHAQLAITAGYPSEARKVLDEASSKFKPLPAAEAAKFTAMVNEANRLQKEDDKLLAQSDAMLAKARDGNPWVNTGLNLVLSGQASKGTEWMLQGIDKGGLRQPEAARLRLAYAYILADRAEQARKQLQAITVSSPEYQLARIWALYLDSRGS